VDAAAKPEFAGRKLALPSRGRFPASLGRSFCSPAAPILAICLCAALVRALTAVFLPSVAWPDETFQATEQALRLVSGRGLTPWEFQIGARSWLLPGLVVPLVTAGRALSSDPKVTFGLITALMIAVSTVNVWSAYVIGARAGRPLHGFFAAGLAAGWSELVYYSPHLLADTVAGALLLAALAVATQIERPGRPFWTGVLLGAAFVVRIQLAPAIGLAGLLACRGAFRSRCLALAAGFAIPVAVLGVVDWLTWGAPFRSVFVYVKTNLGLAALFGAFPPLAYLGEEKQIWGAAVVLVVATAALGARRAPSLAWTAAAIALTFSAVAHKEPRYIYPALLLLFVVCGIGTVELADDLGRRFRTPAVRRALPFGLALLWAAASLSSAVSPELRPAWTREADVLRALAAVNADPNSCGLGLEYPNWVLTGASRVRSDVQLYDAPTTPAGAYNRLLRLPETQTPLTAYPGFALQRCYQPGGACLYTRPGACTGGAPTLRAVTPAPWRAALTRLGFVTY
jgi:hypothetical protein